MIKVLTQIWPHKHTSVSGLRDVTFQSSDPPNVYTLVREKPSSNPESSSAPRRHRHSVSGVHLRSSLLLCVCVTLATTSCGLVLILDVSERGQRRFGFMSSSRTSEKNTTGVIMKSLTKTRRRKKEKTKQQQTRHTVRSQLRRLKTQTQDRSEHHLQMYSCHHKIDGDISHFFLGAACCQVVTGTACDLRIVGSKPCCISVKKKRITPTPPGHSQCSPQD